MNDVNYYKWQYCWPAGLVWLVTTASRWFCFCLFLDWGCHRQTNSWYMTHSILISSECLSKYLHYDFICCCCCVSCSPGEPLVTTLSVTTEQQKHVESWCRWSGISDNMDTKPERERGQLASLHLVCLTRSPCNLYSACAVCVCTSTALLQDTKWQWIHRANFPALGRWMRLLHF